MEKHFLNDMMEGQPTFRPEPWYNPYGDYIIYQMEDEAVVADRVDELLTVYRSAIDNRPIGYQIKGVHAILSRFGLDAITVESHSEQGSVKSISVSMLLLAAYESKPATIGRRTGYADAMRFSQKDIRVDELQAAA